MRDPYYDSPDRSIVALTRVQQETPSVEASLTTWAIFALFIVAISLLVGG